MQHMLGVYCGGHECSGGSKLEDLLEYSQSHDYGSPGIPLITLSPVRSCAYAWNTGRTAVTVNCYRYMTCSNRYYLCQYITLKFLSD